MIPLLSIAKLKIELVDAGEPFVKATYRMEGNGPLAWGKSGGTAFISVHGSSVQQRLLNCYQQEVTFTSFTFSLS